MAIKQEVIKTTNPFEPEPLEQAPAPVPATAQETQPVYGMDLQDLELIDPLQNKPPEPPKYVLEKLGKRDLVWRWLSRPSVKHLGLRNYTVYSPDAEDRKRIDAGLCDPGLFVSSENYLCWGQDAFLGIIPRRLWLARQAAKNARKIQQTKLSRDQSAFRAEAERYGIKRTKIDYKEWRSEMGDDSED